MENASKALLIGGGVLIALLILSIGVYLFVEFRNLGTSYEKNIETSEIQKFNTNFLKSSINPIISQSLCDRLRCRAPQAIPQVRLH